MVFIWEILLICDTVGESATTLKCGDSLSLMWFLPIVSEDCIVKHNKNTQKYIKKRPCGLLSVLKISFTLLLWPWLLKRFIQAFLLQGFCNGFLQTLFNMSSQGYFALPFTLHQSDWEQVQYYTVSVCLRVCDCACLDWAERKHDYMCTYVYIFFHVWPRERIFLSCSYVRKHKD